jgi:hypothetical protein
MRFFVIAVFIAVLQIEVLAIAYGVNKANQVLFLRTIPQPPPAMYRDAPPVDAWMDI